VETSNRLLAPRAADRMLTRPRAAIDFTLKAASKDPVSIDILDDKGAVIRHLTAPGKAGLNRVAWDLRHEAPRLVALRTTPPENPHIWEEPRFRGSDTRSITHWGLAQAEVGPIAAPGKYTAKLTVAGETFSQPLEIVKLPNSHGSDDDLKASVRLQAKVRDDISASSDMVNQIEWMRKQLEDQKKKAHGATLAAMDAIDTKLQDVEYQIITRADALSDDKYFSSAYKLYMNFIWMNGEIGTGAGDVAGSGDYGPTETSIGLVLGLEKQLKAVQDAYRTLMERDVPAYNASLTGSGLAALQTTGAPAPPPPMRAFGGGDDPEN
jgi:hypothetical protein